jgi:hypothetical protein
MLRLHPGAVAIISQKPNCSPQVVPTSQAPERTRTELVINQGTLSPGCLVTHASSPTPILPLVKLEAHLHTFEMAEVLRLPLPSCACAKSYVPFSALHHYYLFLHLAHWGEWPDLTCGNPGVGPLP